MHFRLNNYIAVNVQNYEKSIPFYRDTLGWELIKYTPEESKFKKGDTYFFIAKEDSKPYAVFFEYEVADIKASTEKLLSEGCTIRSTYSPQSIMFTDPYGMNFHVFEKGADLPEL